MTLYPVHEIDPFSKNFKIFVSFAVASTTVWVGRLPRGTHPDTLYDIFSEHGDVKNIDVCITVESPSPPLMFI